MVLKLTSVNSLGFYLEMRQINGTVTLKKKKKTLTTSRQGRAQHFYLIIWCFCTYQFSCIHSKAHLWSKRRSKSYSADFSRDLNSLLFIFFFFFAFLPLKSRSAGSFWSVWRDVTAPNRPADSLEESDRCSFCPDDVSWIITAHSPGRQEEGVPPDARLHCHLLSSRLSS